MENRAELGRGIVYNSGGSRGEPPGVAPPPLFLDQTAARRAEKDFFCDRSPYLRGWLTAPHPPPPPYLKVWIRRCIRRNYYI